MSYDLYDFTETIRLVDVDPESIESVTFAWGYSPEGFGSWEGGFVLRLHDSLDHPVGAKYIYVFGWCDTSGWGCQDGAGCAYFEISPSFTDCARAWEEEFGFYQGEDIPEKQIFDRKTVIIENHDYDPADLNLWLAQRES